LGKAVMRVLIPLDRPGNFLVLFHDDPAWGSIFSRGAAPLPKQVTVGSFPPENLNEIALFPPSCLSTTLIQRAQ